MCGRYFIDIEDSPIELLEIVEKAKEQLAKVDHSHNIKTGEIFISDIVPVIALTKNNVIKPFAMKWGFASFDKNKIIYNARSETSNKKPIFSNGMNSRRCVIPASGFYEWHKTKHKIIKYKIFESENAVMYMAGIYRYEDNPVLPRFVILTSPACSVIASIHSRMPVILDESGVHEWLSYYSEYAPSTVCTNLEVTKITE